MTFGCLMNLPNSLATGGIPIDTKLHAACVSAIVLSAVGLGSKLKEHDNVFLECMNGRKSKAGYCLRYAMLLEE